MATFTADEVKLMAVERASLNDDTLIPDTQTWQWMTNFERRAYTIAAKGNPDYFGTTDTISRAADGDDWDISTGGIGPVQRIEVSAVTGSVDGISVGDEVNITTLDFPDVTLAPRALVRNFTIQEYNDELSTDGSNFVSDIDVYHSQIPGEITSSTQNPEIPDQWIQLLVLPLARLFAIRDQRFDESQLINQEYQQTLQLFREDVQVFDHGADKSLQSRGVPTTAATQQGG